MLAAVGRLPSRRFAACCGASCPQIKLGLKTYREISGRMLKARFS